jgi:hypothetical protein
MSIQTIIDNATSLTIDKGKVAAQSVSRSGVVLTAERATNVPYRFSVSMHEGLTYSTNRGVLEELDKLDITTEESIDIGSTNTGLAYVTAYQGGITGGTITCNGSDGQELYVDCSGLTGSGTLFKKGDFLQPLGNTAGYRYPYQVTSDVAFSTGANVTIPVHRPVISQDGVALTSGNVNKGSDVTFKVKMQEKVDYTILPYDRIRFNGRFNLVEIITT